MIRTKGRYHHQRVELDHPLRLEEGTEVEMEIRVAGEGEEQVWSDLGMSRLEEEWNNPGDAIYDNWKQLYGV